MTLFAKQTPSILTASLLLGYANVSLAAPIDNIPGANPTIQSLANMIDDYLNTTNRAELNNAKERELFDICDAYRTDIGNAETQDQINDAIALLELVSHEEVGAVGSGFTDTGQDLVGNAIGRMQFLRTGTPALASNSFLLGQTGGAAGDDFSRLSVYSNLSYGDGSKDQTLNEQGFDFDSQTLTLGGDYRFSNNLVGGMAIGYGASEVDMDNNTGETEADTLSITAYTSIYEGNWYMDASIGFGMHEYDTSRRVRDIGLGVSQTLTAKPEGDSLNLSLGAGFDQQLGQISANYSLRIDSVSASVDGYSEAGGSLALDIGKQEVDSLQGVLGTQFSMPISTDSGVFVPSFGIEMHQEFDDETRIVTASYRFDPGNNQFSFTSDDADENFFLISTGASWVMSQGNQLFLNWDHLAGLDDVSSNTITAGLRLEL
ncbi:MAG: hypothetical protein C9356_10450 [Oleiphilus sp.]|nr:MAG: hypothetical protein C9356_10450 [Oleiphilus sp.]